MIIKIGEKNYRIKENLAAAAKRTVHEVLEKVRIQAQAYKADKFYTAFIIMMYVTTSTILQELDQEDVHEILNEQSPKNQIYVVPK